MRYLLVAVLALTGCKTRYQKCIDRGIEYYKEIGSFPTLSDGRDALDVAMDHCKRAPDTAYP